MPGLLHPSAQFGNCPTGSLSSNGIWSRHRDDIGIDQLQKFWSELPLEARQELLKIEKHTLFEHARKNLYCSRCNGLLIEGYSQIVMYGKSLLQEGACVYGANRTVHSTVQSDGESDNMQDPSVYPWGGLTATKDSILTLLDCFLNAKSLKALQNVFNSARARERERELLYPDACGGGGRGWISQGVASYGRAYGIRETCALHTARLSCDTLVDFWSALSDETRLSLLRMKEEDFIERLMYRFDSKRFCRDCRRNVIREFKELKELKRMRREPRCSSWFCVADTAFQYEVSEDTVEADWHQSFTESVGAYHHFEWAIGTAEGKSDILDFEDVGMNGKVIMNGLDLGGLSACFITLRAWKLDGRCTELFVKAHALKGQPCVHRRIIVGDGFVTITKGESIRRFFEHAEEVEEEEDDDAMDKDGSDYDGDGSRPQKHAKSPELAREFLLDAATVIFKEQVEKAFREGTARQNAHSIFVCLSLKLLEERIHVACKEIITLEKQVKLLEEEEKEKRDEEERKERRRTKEREKKHRRKERLKGKEREREEREHADSDLLQFALAPSTNDLSTSTHDDSPNTPDSGGSISEAGDPISPDSINEQSLDGDLKSDGLWHQCHVDGELSSRDGNGSFILEQSKSSRRKLRFKQDSPLDHTPKWYNNSVHHDESDRKVKVHALRSLRERVVKTNTRNCNLKFHCSNSRMRDRYDFHSCSCSQQGSRRPKDEYHNPTIRSNREMKPTNKPDSSACAPRPLFKQVWEPMDARKKCTRINPDPDIASRSAVKRDSPHSILGKSSTSQQELEDSRKRPDDQIAKSDSEINGCDPVMSSSSSDNCSSCLSEVGDGSTSSSIAQTADLLSTSDSEDVSFTRTTTGYPVASCTGANFPREEEPARLGRQHMLPMHDQGIHVPIFPSPTMSWPAATTNGLMPFPHHNHYVYPCPFGFGVPEYNTLQPMPIPLLSLRQHSLYPTNNSLYFSSSKDNIKNLNVPAPQQIRQLSSKTVPSGQNGSVGSAAKRNGDAPSFSLFHFGGPVAGSAGYSVNPVYVKEGKTNLTCSKEDTTIEEYSLFAASTGAARFSFF